jgi:DNA-binding LacI/PurR family transcriptional regulator
VVTPVSSKVTFAQAAQLAGISRSALSIVINQRTGVSATTRRRVEKLLTRIGYSPAPLARRRGVRKAMAGRLRRVGVLIVGYSSKHQMQEHAKVFWNAIASASGEIERLGAKPELVFLPDPEHPPANLLEAGLEGWIGIGAMPEPKPWPEMLRQHLNPIVWMPCSAGLGWGDAVGINQEATGVIAAQYLYESGVRTAAVIGQLNTRPIRTRTDSFVLRFQQMGGNIVPMRPLRSFYTRSRTPDLFAVDVAVDDLFRTKKRADGIFVTSDCFVPEVYRELKRNSCQPGIDIKVIGCSNERDYFRDLAPKPATIDIRAEEIALRAVRQLWWRRQHPEAERFAVILEPRLVLPAAS